MSIFACESCGVATNTVYSASYHSRFMEELWEAEYIGKKLCWDCGPQEFKSGEPVEMNWEKGPDGLLRLKRLHEDNND